MQQTIMGSPRTPPSVLPPEDPSTAVDVFDRVGDLLDSVKLDKLSLPERKKRLDEAEAALNVRAARLREFAASLQEQEAGARVTR